MGAVMENIGWRNLLIFWGVVVAIILGGMALGYAKDRPPLGFWFASVVMQSESGLLVQQHTQMPSEAACRARIMAQRILAPAIREAQLKKHIPDPFRAISVECRFLILDRIDYNEKGS